MILEEKGRYVYDDFERVLKDYKEFEWDDRKSDKTYLDRGLSFDVVVHIFENVRIECSDYGSDHFDARDEGERIYTIGKMRGKRGEVVYCVVIFIELNDSKIRIISARYAEKDERRCYHEYC